MRTKLLASMFLCAMLAVPAVYSQTRAGRVLDTASRLFPAAKQAVKAKLGRGIMAAGLSLLVACGLTGCADTSTDRIADVGVSERDDSFEVNYVSARKGDRVAFLSSDGSIQEGQLTGYYSYGNWWVRTHLDRPLVHHRAFLGIYSPNDPLVGTEVSFDGAHVGMPDYEDIFAVIDSVYVDNEGSPTVYALNPTHEIRIDGIEMVIHRGKYVLQANTVNFLFVGDSNEG